MKFNNKGFAISSIMYLILVITIILVSLTLALLNNRKLILDKIKIDVLNKINEENFYDASKIVVELNGLVPVIYDGVNWVITDENSKWYDYSKQMWANAVILKEGVDNTVGNIIYPTGDNLNIKAMFVYIPRYEYKISGTYGKGGISASLPGEIQVNFISKDVKTPTSGYILHPAFTFGEYDLSGIWVGKFETTGSATSPTILPGYDSLKNQIVSEEFESAKIFNDYLNNSAILDAHMAKNSEWGAAAYLSQSRYGKYGNNDYALANKEVMPNNCTNYITGIAANSYDEEYNTLVCETNYYDTQKGQASSTTGNIYGIYDMSGGSWEYTMGYYELASTTWGATDTVDYAGFTYKPDSKYYDSYTSLDVKTACNNGPCYGQSLFEVSSWYNDISHFIRSDNPWLTRGGNIAQYTTNGIFYAGRNMGNSSKRTSFRVVMSPIIIN